MIKFIKENRVRIIAIIIITIIWATSIMYFYNESIEECDTYQKAELRTIDAEINSLINTYNRFASFVYQQTLNKEEIFEVVYDGYHRNDPYRVVLRSELLSQVRYGYELITQYGFGAVQFHFANGINFLRVNNPEVFGDYVFDNLETVKNASEEKRLVQGYDIGKTFSGFRYVFPMNYLGEFIGTVDIAVKLDAAVDILEELYPSREIIYVLEKRALGIKENEKDLSYYGEFANFNEFILDENMKSKLENQSEQNLLFKNKKIFNEIKEKSAPLLESREEFSFIIKAEGKVFLAQFLPIINLSEETVGYYITLEENNRRVVIQSEFQVQVILLTVTYILALIAYLDYYRNKKRIQRLADRDHLTDLYNRHKFTKLLNKEVERSMRNQNTFSIAMLDIDHFKEVNDKYGHNVGDKVLVELADSLKHSLREYDIYARWGGEEFIVLMPETKRDQAMKVAERLRKNIEEHSFEPVSDLTVSIGVAQKPPRDNNIDELISRADDALYDAKEKGRNRVEKR